MLLLLEKVKNWLQSNNSKLLPIGILILLIFVLRGFFVALYDKIVSIFKSQGSTLTSESAKLLVEKLEVYFNQLTFSDNKIIELLAPLSTSDYYKLKDVFGSKYRNPFTGEISWWWFPGAKSLNLTEWLANELPIEKLNELRALNPNLPI